jgi:hypothetical protein
MMFDDRAHDNDEMTTNDRTKRNSFDIHVRRWSGADRCANARSADAVSANADGIVLGRMLHTSSSFRNANIRRRYHVGFGVGVVADAAADVRVGRPADGGALRRSGLRCVFFGVLLRRRAREIEMTNNRFVSR